MKWLKGDWFDYTAARGSGQYQHDPLLNRTLEKARELPTRLPSMSERTGPDPTRREYLLWQRSNPRTQDDLIHNGQYTTRGTSFGAILWYRGAEESEVERVNGILAGGMAGYDQAGYDRGTTTTLSPIGVDDIEVA